MIKRFLHLRFDALARERLFVLLAEEWVFEPIGNRGAAFGHVDCALVGILLAGHAGLVLAMIVGAVPADQPQRFLADPEVRVKPVAPIWRGRHHADRLVILP